MNGILLIDFNLATCDFLKFDWCKMLNGYANFTFNILENDSCISRNVVKLKMVQIKHGLRKTLFIFRHRTYHRACQNLLCTGFADLLFCLLELRLCF